MKEPEQHHDVFGALTPESFAATETPAEITFPPRHGERVPVAMADVVTPPLTWKDAFGMFPEDEDEWPEMVWSCCGKSGTQHLGIEGACRHLQAARQALRAVLDDPAMMYRRPLAFCSGREESVSEPLVRAALEASE